MEQAKDANMLEGVRGSVSAERAVLGSALCSDKKSLYVINHDLTLWFLLFLFGTAQHSGQKDQTARSVCPSVCTTQIFSP